MTDESTDELIAKARKFHEYWIARHGVVRGIDFELVQLLHNLANRLEQTTGEKDCAAQIINEQRERIVNSEMALAKANERIAVLREALEWIDLDWAGNGHLAHKALAADDARAKE